MPGKVNPVIPEMVNQLAYQVMGNDLTVMLACEGGQLQLNAFEPVMVANLFQSIGIMKRAMRILSDRCIAGITANIGSEQQSISNLSGYCPQPLQANAPNQRDPATERQQG